MRSFATKSVLCIGLILLCLCFVLQADAASWDNDTILAGAYGGLAGYDDITYPLVRDYSFDWMWLQHQSTVKQVLEGNQEVISQLTDMAAKSRLILRLWPWGSQWGGGTMWSTADPMLDGKDWLHVADSPTLLQAVYDSIDTQIDAIVNACGPNSLYGVSISEEEPVVGMACGRGIGVVTDDTAKQKIINVSNAIYNHIKANYPGLKIGISFYPSDFLGNPYIFSLSQMNSLQRDMVVMDCYPSEGALQQSVQTWTQYYPPATETYVILWGLGSWKSGSYTRLGRTMDISGANETLQAFFNAGYTNLGWFGLGYVNPVKEWALKEVEIQSPGNAASWDASERWSRLDGRLPGIRSTWNTISSSLPSNISQQGTTKLNDAQASLDLYEFTGIQRQTFVDITTLLWETQVLALDYAAPLERKLENCDLLHSVASSLGKDSIYEQSNIPDQAVAARRAIQEEATLYETLPDFFQNSASPLGEIDGVVTDLVSHINDLKNQYPSDTTIQTIGQDMIDELLAGDYAGAKDVSMQLGPYLSEQGLNNRHMIRVVLLNPYSYGVNAHPAIRFSDDGSSWETVYWEKPFAETTEQRFELQVYTCRAPNYVMVDNGDWFGWFNVERVEIVNASGGNLHWPMSATAYGDASGASVLLNPQVGLYATILTDNTPSYFADYIIVQFESFFDTCQTLMPKGEVTLTDGNRILKSWPDNNWNSSILASEILGFEGAAAEFRMFFHVPVLGSEFTIGDTATLHVTATATSSIGSNEELIVRVYPLTRAWTDAQVTWNKANSSTSWTTGGGDYETGTYHSFSIRAHTESPEGEYTVDVTNILEYWESQPNYGIILVPQNVGGGGRYVGFENAFGSEPYITIFGNQTCEDIWQSGGGIPSDINHDCQVDIDDVMMFIEDWLRCNVPGQEGCEVN